MSKLIFVNLPVSDLPRSIAFYEAVGFTRDDRFADASAQAVSLSETIHVMLMTHARFQDFTTKPIPDPKAHAQALFCISADSRADVDATIAKAEAAGARIDPSPVDDYGWMYGRSYEDPDGFLWGVNWMDVEAATAAMSGAQSEPVAA